MRAHASTVSLLRAMAREAGALCRRRTPSSKETHALALTHRTLAKFAFSVSMCLHFGPMGALMRATRKEIAELVAGDADWWPNFCGALAEKGRGALKDEITQRGWSWGALWGWIVGDVERYREYMKALEAHVQMLALETVGIADGYQDKDGVEDAKLRVATRFKLAEKVDSARWGDKAAGGGGGVKVVLVNFVQDAQGRVIEGGINELEADTARVAVSGISGGEAAQIKGLTQGE